MMEALILLLMIGGGIYWFRKRRQARRDEEARRSGRSMGFLDDKLDQLAFQLHEEMICSEKMAQATYLQWKADREREKRITLATGVILPRSRWSEEQDRVFLELERGLEQKKQMFLAANRREAETADKVAEMERKTAEAVNKALGDDLT